MLPSMVLGGAASIHLILYPPTLAQGPCAPCSARRVVFNLGSTPVAHFTRTLLPRSSPILSFDDASSEFLTAMPLSVCIFVIFANQVDIALGQLLTLTLTPTSLLTLALGLV
ncbi:hypothetical protein NW767_004289 [Fusarium falciforme]|uniref:Uncharacterized protein n=1 Tax=Fusarium falciforme TaxID=195108 RepID=A0A9W8R5I6_9HYPO|nr:hypothetical protein NW755_008472 [Fusarium falciforme]KAJ4204777.1 hypothetical protein NW767_004289 [Fusarium falciforme]KAJ4243280.1 hypothetical protein NW757_011389 [Fusarium falciforme]